MDRMRVSPSVRVLLRLTIHRSSVELVLVGLGFLAKQWLCGKGCIYILYIMVGILGFAWAKIREDIDPLPENSLRSRLVALLHLALLRAFALRPQLDLYFFFRLVSCKDVLVDRVLVEELCVPIFVGRCFFFFNGFYQVRPKP